MSEEQTIEAPKAKSFDDLEAELGDGDETPSNRIEFNSIEDLAAEADENGEPLVAPPPRLDYEQMAECVYETIMVYNMVLHGHTFKPSLHWNGVEDRVKQKYIARVAMCIQSASDPNDDNLARVFHAQDVMELLTEGWIYAEEFDFDEQATPHVVPWEYAKPEDKVEYYLFRRTVKSLLAVWNGH